MPRRKADYHLKKIAFSVCAPRWLLDEFNEVVQEHGFSRSEVVSQLMKNFVSSWKNSGKN